MGYTPPYLNVTKGSGIYTLSVPGSVTTDDLQIVANIVDGISYITLYGLGNIKLRHGNGAQIVLTDSLEYGYFQYTTPDFIIKSATDKNISLVPQGTGKVKFGAFTASGDVAVNGLMFPFGSVMAVLTILGTRLTGSINWIGLGV